MKHLFAAELARFRSLALVFAGVHLLVLYLASKVIPLFAADAAKSSLGILAYSLLGLLFGLYQMGTYRRPNLWAWLINRPLPISGIFLALTGAAAVLALGVVALPVLVMTLYTDFFTGQWVDARHYPMSLFLFGLVMSFYFVGSFVAAKTSRAAILVAVLPAFFLTREAVGQWVFVPMVLVLAWLAYLSFRSFEPELEAPVRGRPAQVASAVPMAYALLFVLSTGLLTAWSIGTIVREHGPLGFSTFAWNDYWEPGHLLHVGYLSAEDALAHGLRLAEGDRAAELSAQLGPSEVFELPGPFFSRFPRRHQPFFLDQRHELIDRENEIWWTFGHDEMAFLGHEIRTGRPVGRLGPSGAQTGPGTPSVAGAPGVAETPGVAEIPDGALAEEIERFEQVPYVIDHRFVVEPRRIREIDLARQTLDTRFELPPGERFVMPFVEHRSFVVAMSDARLYFFDPRELKLGRGAMGPQLSTPLPDVPRNLSRILVAEMLDSYLVSFVVGSQSERGYHDAYQQTVELPIVAASEVSGSDAPEPEMVARVELANGLPAWLRHRGFLLSPVLQHAHDLAWTAIGPAREERVELRDIVSRPVPAPIAWGALVVAMASAAGAYWLATRRRLDPADRRFWTLLAFVLGVPGWLAVAFSTRPDETAEGRMVESSPRAVSAGMLPGEPGWSA